MAPDSLVPARLRGNGGALGEYLRARRALVDPRDVGLPVGGRRRVEGLRRDEVAAAAGISGEYYLRLEQGRGSRPSDTVLRSLATALRLDPDGADHLRTLVEGRPGRAVLADRSASPSVEALLGQVGTAAVFVLDRNQDVIAANRTAQRLSPTMRVGANRLLALFATDGAERAVDRPATLRNAVAALRREGIPEDPRHHEVVGTLSVRSAEFRALWARHDVGRLAGGALTVDVPPFGPLALRSTPFVVADRQQTVVTVAGVTDAAQAALTFLASGADDSVDRAGAADPVG